MNRFDKFSIVALAVSLGACAGDMARDRIGPTRFTIQVAPLTLSEVGDATWSLAVTNLAGDPVWSEPALTSDRFGDGRGSLSYVGPCDATSSPNSVTLQLVSLRTPAGLPVTDWVDPGPIAQSVPCLPDQDTQVDFDVTIFRSARQGFFDIGVDFADIFCSAKLDCEDSAGADIDLLHRPGGDRDATVIFAFACTAGGDTTTQLRMSDVSVLCGDGGRYFIDPSREVGNHEGFGDAIFATALYRGREQFPDFDKCYWNTAIGMSFTTAAPSCTLTAEATAVDAAEAPDGTAIYPVIRWNVPLSGPTGERICERHGLGDGAEVQVEYRAYDDVSLPYAMSCATAPVASGPDRTLCDGSLAGNTGSFAVSGSGAAARIQVAVGADQSAEYTLPTGYSASACCANPCCGGREP